MKRQTKYSQYDFTFLEQIPPHTEEAGLDCSFKYLEQQAHYADDEHFDFSYLDTCWQPKDDL